MPESIKEEVKKPEVIKKETTEQKLDKVLGLLERVVEQLTRPSLQGIVEKQIVSHQSETQTNFDPTNYVPNEYREIVTQVLSKDFGIEVSPLSDSPAFQFTIICPDKYSTISPEHKAMYGKDIRPKVITNGEGSIGVRAWAERVWMSFNPTIQALIVSDRTK